MIKEREYLCSVNKFNKPVVKTKQAAIALLLLRLIILEPGSDPLHPDMGVGIRRYRYTMNTVNELRQRIKDQIDTYIPCFKASEVNLVITPDKLCNVEITVNDTIYTYDSKEAPIPIRIEDATE